MTKKILTLLLGALILASAQLAQAAQTKVYRVGVIYHGGAWNAVVDGLRDGLKKLGLEEGKHFVLEIRDAKGDVKAVEAAAKNLERDKVDLLYAVGTSVTIPVRRATSDIPIVFYAGGDLVGLGLVDSFAKPGGRLTGVYSQVTDLTAKRLENPQGDPPKAPSCTDLLRSKQPCFRGRGHHWQRGGAAPANRVGREACCFRRGTSGQTAGAQARGGGWLYNGVRLAGAYPGSTHHRHGEGEEICHDAP